jgi:hypothetical protein
MACVAAVLHAGIQNKHPIFCFAMLDQLFGFECSHSSRANLRADSIDETNSLGAKQKSRETNFVSMIQPHLCDVTQCQNLCSSPGCSPPHLTCPASLSLGAITLNALDRSDFILVPCPHACVGAI